MDKKLVRRRKRLFRYAVDLFVDIVSKARNRRVNYRATDTDEKAWNAFCDYFEDEFGEDFLKVFITFGLSSFLGKNKERDHTRSVRFHWIVSRAAIERWKRNDRRTNIYIIRRGIKRDYDLREHHSSTLPLFINEIRPSEERFKAEFYNSIRGFAWCIANTTLYNHRSEYCSGCNFKSDCLETLRVEFPGVYVSRGYGKR